MTWTAEHETLLRAEVERRFRARTPATRIDEVLPENRVMRGEIRHYSLSQFGELPPELDRDWAIAFAKWYRKMAKRIDPAAKFRGPVTLS